MTEHSLSPNEREELELLRRKEAERAKNILGTYKDGDIRIEVHKNEFWNSRQNRMNYTVGLKGLGNETFFGAQKFMAIVMNLLPILNFFKDKGQLNPQFDLDTIFEEVSTDDYEESFDEEA